MLVYKAFHGLRAAVREAERLEMRGVKADDHAQHTLARKALTGWVKVHSTIKRTKQTEEIQVSIRANTHTHTYTSTV